MSRKVNAGITCTVLVDKLMVSMNYVYKHSRECLCCALVGTTLLNSRMYMGVSSTKDQSKCSSSGSCNSILRWRPWINEAVRLCPRSERLYVLHNMTLDNKIDPLSVRYWIYTACSVNLRPVCWRFSSKNFTLTSAHPRPSTQLWDPQCINLPTLWIWNKPSPIKTRWAAKRLGC